MFQSFNFWNYKLLSLSKMLLLCMHMILHKTFILWQNTHHDASTIFWFTSLILVVIPQRNAYFNSVDSFFKCSHQFVNNSIICNIWVIRAQVSSICLQILMHCVNIIEKLLHANCWFTSCNVDNHLTQQLRVKGSHHNCHLYILHLPVNPEEWVHHLTTTMEQNVKDLMCSLMW